MHIFIISSFVSSLPPAPRSSVINLSLSRLNVNAKDNIDLIEPISKVLSVCREKGWEGQMEGIGKVVEMAVEVIRGGMTL